MFLRNRFVLAPWIITLRTSTSRTSTSRIIASLRILVPGLTVGIRRATRNDVAELNHVRAMAIGNGVAGKDLRTRIDAANVFTYLAEEDTPFGFVTVGASEVLTQPAEALVQPAEALTQPAEALDNVTGEILEWYLRPEFWHRGFGAKLLVHGLSVLKRRMYEQAIIWLPEKADRAEAITLRLGFEHYGAEKILNDETGSHSAHALVKDLSEYF